MPDATSDRYTIVNPKIPQNPAVIWAAVKKRLPGKNEDEFLHGPRPVYFGDNVRVAYPSFLTWLKFCDPDRRSGDLDSKIMKYDLGKTRYEQQIPEFLKEFREGKKDGKTFATPPIVMARIDRAGKLLTFSPSRWDKREDPYTRTEDQDAAVGTIRTGRVSAGSAATIRVSPDNLLSRDKAADIPEGSVDEIILHELVHAMFAMDGKETSALMTGGWNADYEFFAIQVVNVYRSEKGFRKMRARHLPDPENKVFMDASDNLLDHKEIVPPPEILIGRFQRHEPEVSTRLAAIPQAKAQYNPFRELSDKQKKAPKDDD